jgi:IS30 family transposase
MKNQHLTDLERLEIEHALRQRTSLKKIAVQLGKHHSTLSREILSRRIASDKGAFGRITNRCVRRRRGANKSDDQQPQNLPK